MIKIQKDGEIIKGKIHDMPMELFGEISELKNGEKIIEKMVANAEKEFFCCCMETAVTL